MSTLEVDSIVASTSNTDLSLDGAGTGVVNLATGAKLNGVALTDTFSTQSPANPNLIINGDMRIAQRGTSFAAPSDGAFTLDRWKQFNSGGGVYTVTQDTSIVPAGFANSLKFDVTTADAAIAAADYYQIQYILEGLDISHLKWGTADAQDVTLSFWVSSSKTGTHSISFSNNGSSRTYVAEYTVSVADTLEYKTITIPGDTSGTWLTTNGKGLGIVFILALGSNYTTASVSSWQAANNQGSTNQVNCMDNIANNFFLTGVKLEVGSTATAFVPDDYGTALAKCMRYYWRVTEDGTLQIANSFHFSTTQGLGILPLPVIMRSDASGTFSNAADFNVNALTSGIDVTALTLNSTPTAAKFTYTVASSLTAGHGSHIYFDGAGTRWFALDAEL